MYGYFRHREIQELAQVHTPSKGWQWALWGHPASVALEPLLCLLCHMPHPKLPDRPSHPHGKLEHLLQMTRMEHVYPAAGQSVSISCWCPVGTKEKKTTSRPGFFRLPQAVLLCLSTSVNFQDIILWSESGLFCGGLFLKLMDAMTFGHFQERSGKAMAVFTFKISICLFIYLTIYL